METASTVKILTRRQFIQLSGAATLAGSLANASASDAPEPYVTCFYQFGPDALRAFSGPGGLPNGPQFLHIMSNSHPGIRAHPEAARSVHACGESFKYALAFDVHKYKGWMTAPKSQLKRWAEEFRALALDPRGPADYFAFNEMPTTGPANPALRAQVGKLVRYLHDPGNGPRLKGIFYFTERNLNPARYVGPSDDFWTALDDSCDYIIGEHYHNDGFTFAHTIPQLSDHLFALPRWLEKSKRPAQVAIAQRKYIVLHSSYYGPDVTGWAGLLNTTNDPKKLEHYFDYVVAATRHDPFGKRRVGFGPLQTRQQDPRMVPILARVLGKDAKKPDFHLL